MQENELGSICPIGPTNGQTKNSFTLYTVAKECLGISLVPAGDDPEYGCAISLNMLSLRAFGHQIGGGASTTLLLKDLVIQPHNYTEVREPLPGDIIISATGTSIKPNPAIPNGHVGVVGQFGIMSNNSDDGLWSEAYTLASWDTRYRAAGGFPTRFFRIN